MNHPLIFTALLALGIGATDQARAAEGAYEINQDCAAVGCFPGDAAGFPVTISQSGRYVLTSDLVATGDVASKVMINGGADSIDLDLNGHKLEGGQTCSGTPVTECTLGPGFRGIELSLNVPAQRMVVHVHDGYIHGFASLGMYILNAGDGTVIEHMTVSENGGGIAFAPPVSAVGHLRVRDSQAVRNYGSGIDGSNNGDSQLFVENCMVAGNIGAGIVLGTNSAAVGNRVSSNAGPGIVCAGLESVCALGQNTLSGNSGGGPGSAWSIPILRDMGGNVCLDTGTCP